jgi:hypothetical protein
MESIYVASQDPLLPVKVTVVKPLFAKLILATFWEVELGIDAVGPKFQL